MKKLRVGINGFGRIGRAVFRNNFYKKYFDVVVINEINPDNQNIAYLLKYDSTYGKLDARVGHDKNRLAINGKKIYVYHKDAITDVPWEKHNVDLVIESSGIKRNLENIDVLKSKIRNLVTTYDPNIKAQTVIFGVNEKKINPKKNFVLSTSICDAVSLSPILKIITKSHRIVSGFLTTIHPWLSYQNLLDGPSISWSVPGDIFSHYALGRSSINNIIPKSTSAILAAEKVIPNLSKKIISFSFRSPTSIVSSGVLTVMLNKPITERFLNNKFYAFERRQKYKIIRNSIDPLTSIDYIGEEYSAIIDHRWTKINNKKHIQLVYWYDNEWGYSSKVVDLIREISKHYAKK